MTFSCDVFCLQISSNVNLEHKNVFLGGRMYEILWINKAIVNGSGSRACGFFSSQACFSEIDTGYGRFTPQLLSKDSRLSQAEHVQPGPGEELRV